ncbi:MAG TPA: dihydroorotate dehydrogenase electron transfer subunit [Burkholderiales bacterium]
MSAPFPLVEAPCPVVSNDWVNEDYKHLVLDAEHGATHAAPGQFFHLLCPSIGDNVPFFRRPMSIYRIDAARGRLEFLYKIVGRGTTTLATLAPGDRLNIFGPLGRPFEFARARHILQVARGVGLATLAPVAEAAARLGMRTTALLSARSPQHLMSVDYLRSVGAQVLTVTDSEGTSDVAAVERTVRRLIEEENADFLVTCGSNRLLQLLQRLGREYKIAGEVALEQHMGCGNGMCFACVREFHSAEGGINYRRVCWEGPVFDLQEAVTW